MWRWFSEENLNHLPDKHVPLTLSMFAELAKANFCSVQLFYHSDVRALRGWEAKKETCQFDSHDCALANAPITPKQASLATFKHTVMALSRTSGCYPIINYDRKQ